MRIHRAHHAGCERQQRRRAIRHGKVVFLGEAQGRLLVEARDVLAGKRKVVLVVEIVIGKDLVGILLYRPARRVIAARRHEAGAQDERGHADGQETAVVLPEQDDQRDEAHDKGGGCAIDPEEAVGDGHCSQQIHIRRQTHQQDRHRQERLKDEFERTLGIAAQHDGLLSPRSAPRLRPHVGPSYSSAGIDGEQKRAGRT